MSKKLETNFDLAGLFREVLNLSTNLINHLATEEDRCFFYDNSFLMQNEHISNFMSILMKGESLGGQYLKELHQNLQSYAALIPKDTNNLGAFISKVCKELQEMDFYDDEKVHKFCETSKKSLEDAVRKYVEAGLKDVDRNGVIQVNGVYFKCKIEPDQKNSIESKIISYLERKTRSYLGSSPDEHSELKNTLISLFKESNEQGKEKKDGSEMNLELDQLISMLMVTNQAAFTGMSAMLYQCVDLQKLTDNSIAPSVFLNKMIKITTRADGSMKIQTEFTFNGVIEFTFNGEKDSKTVAIATGSMAVTVNSALNGSPMPSIREACITYNIQGENPLFAITPPPIVKSVQDEIKAKALFGEERWNKFTEYIQDRSCLVVHLEESLSTMTKLLKDTKDKDIAESAISAIVTRISNVEKVEEKKDLIKVMEKNDFAMTLCEWTIGTPLESRVGKIFPNRMHLVKELHEIKKTINDAREANPESNLQRKSLASIKHARNS